MHKDTPNLTENCASYITIRDVGFALFVSARGCHFFLIGELFCAIIDVVRVDVSKYGQY